MTSTTRTIDIWSQDEIRILRELALTASYARDIALALAWFESTVRHKLTDLQITPIYRLSFSIRDAIEHLGRERQPVRRIAIRARVPIPFVQEHLNRARVGKGGEVRPRMWGKVVRLGPEGVETGLTASSRLHRIIAVPPPLNAQTLGR